MSDAPTRSGPVIADLLPTETASPDETIALGRRLAAALQPGDVVALYGDLGAGKTHLVKGICAGLGVAPAAVTSPTFTLVNEYRGDLPVFHFDAYRVERPDEFFDLGYEDYFFGDGVSLVEWPERVEGLIPPEAIRLRLAHGGGDVRRVEVADEL
jgi:tRNA threonylcarbamoyladenosine biosynthesis protein TsaE